MKPCHTTLINVGTKNELNNEQNGYAQLYAYFSSNVVQSREHYFITIIKLAGQIGGYIGLFRLALTLLNLAKFDKLTEGVTFIGKNEELVDVPDEESNAENGEDVLIGLTPLAINANSFRVMAN